MLRYSISYYKSKGQKIVRSYSNTQFIEYIIRRYRDNKYSIEELCTMFDYSISELNQLLFDYGETQNTHWCFSCCRLRSKDNFNTTKYNTVNRICKRCETLKRVKRTVKNLKTQEEVKHYIIHNYQRERYDTKELALLFDVSEADITYLLKSISEDVYNRQSYFCIRCNQPKPKHEFYDNEVKYGRFTCIRCHCQSRANYYRLHKEEHFRRTHRINNKPIQFNSRLAKELVQYEETQESDDNYLMVKCVNSGCQKWFKPTYMQCHARLRAIKGEEGSPYAQNNFYCSEECKNSCSIYAMQTNQFNNVGQIKLKHNYTRIDQPDLRKLALERDGNVCQICGVEYDESQLICHHIEPVVCNPVESADVDNCIMLCPICDEHVHSLPGCTLSELSQFI